MKVGGDGNSGKVGILITGLGGVNLIASGTSGVIAVLLAITIADLLIFLGWIDAFTSKATIGSLTGSVLAIPYFFINSLLLLDADFESNEFDNVEYFLLSNDIFLS